jgi:hypothetical protein
MDKPVTRAEYRNKKRKYKMGLIKGLASIGTFNAEQERRREAANAPKVKYLTLKKSGDSVRVRFLQELDADSKNYSEKNDLGFLAVMHQAPGTEGYKRTAQCTRDEGACFPCEQREAGDYENWKRGSANLYINAVVNPDTDEEEVVLVKQTATSRSITPTLIEYAGETGSITDRVWKITRNGEGKETSYNLVAFDKQDFKNDVESYELFDLTRAARLVPYEEQEVFYGHVAASAPAASSEEKPKDDFSTW